MSRRTNTQHESPYNNTDSKQLRKDIKSYIGKQWDDFTTTLAQAERMRVPYGPKKKKTNLREIANDKAHGGPVFLDNLLDRLDPGTELFYAVTLVAEKYQHNIGAAVMEQLEQIRDSNSFTKRHRRGGVKRGQILPHKLRELDHGQANESNRNLD